MLIYPSGPRDCILISQMILTVYLSDGEQAVTEVPITPETTCRDVVEFCKEPGESGCHLAEVWRGNGKGWVKRRICGPQRGDVPSRSTALSEQIPSPSQRVASFTDVRVISIFCRGATPLSKTTSPTRQGCVTPYYTHPRDWCLILCQSAPKVSVFDSICLSF